MKKVNKFSGLLMILAPVFFYSCTQKIYNNAGSNAIKITAVPTINPIFKRMETNPFLHIKVNIPAGNQEITYQQLSGTISGNVQDIAELEVYGSNDKAEFTTDQLLGSITSGARTFTISFSKKLTPGIHHLWLSVRLKESANTEKAFDIKAHLLKDATGLGYKIEQAKSGKRYLGIAIRKAKDENVHTYRIPGMITTDKGTLISVYDIRYDHSGDLPANIDVGMSRSTDQGETWEGMKNIMDMEGPNDNSGVGDPAILFDPATKTIWVTALWSKGNRSIAGSGPGLTPEETGQFALTFSTDDGLTWAKPYSITKQVKNPEWRLFFPGPGNGIAMADGKLVFPAQYWDAQKMPHSTLIYSEDHGKTWKSGIGAKSNTTESQLVETTPGTLMLNMRDNRGKFRSVSTTTNMGQSWSTHATSYNTLTDPVCMAGFIKARVNIKGEMKDVLFFSNQNNPKSRQDFTIKASLDMGETWLPANQLLIDERKSYGYSALSKVDDNHIGILYEGIRSLLFVKIPVSDIIK
ncbi:sialidase family protein [Pedobacter frigoris]|uniref:exo-alpha-sialidase n=1 Tax=Pedobacter frigoris TaxID=2571272 RepID=A0A4U1CNK7_9SPHI|nr:sialidase family protein [Pedobacter frigoris]TKC09531.1 glycosyl hydrolase [Pedobacter frigoris]